MRNHHHSFSSLSTTNYEHEIDNHLDEDSYDLNLSVSSLAKLNRKKPQISTILKLNLIVVLIISLFIKLTVVSIINGSLSAFLALKLLTHGLILYTFMKRHYISLQLLFVLDVILFVIFLLFEFLLLVSNFAVIIIQHKRNKNLGFIGIWLMILIAAIDLLILVMVAIVLENYRKPKERLQQLEAKLVTVVHNGRLLASQMCKSGSYLLGFVCNSQTGVGVSNNSNTNSSNNGLLLNGTPRIYRDAEDPNRISCINTQEGSSFSLNDDEYIHYSSVEINNELIGNRFHSFSDFYNFNNRNNRNPTTAEVRERIEELNNNLSNLSNTNPHCSITDENNTTTNELTSIPAIATIENDDQLTTIQSLNKDPISLTSIITSTIPYSNISSAITTTSNVNSFSNSLTSTLNSNSSQSSIMNNIITNVTASSSFATTSTFNTTIKPITSNLINKQEQSRNVFERMNPFNSTPFKTVNNLIDNQQSNDDESTFIHMYQCNVDEDGDPIDGPLKCTRTTVINTTNTDSLCNNQASSSTVVQMNRNIGERVLNTLNSKPVYI